MNTTTDTLIIHIGLPKTASQTLGKRCFSQFENTITIFSSEEWKLNTNQNLLNLFRYIDPSLFDTYEGKKYLDQLHVASRRTLGKPLFISNVSLIIYPMFNGRTHWFSGKQLEYFPVSLCIEALLNTCPWISKIKILLTLRNQPQWLASLYAQHSGVDSASTLDFERQVRNLMCDDSLNGGGFLNWDKMVHDLYRAVGKDNVYVLLIEDINKLSYWKTLAEASELPFDPAHFLSISNMPATNVRKTGYNNWGIADRTNPFNYDNCFWNFVKRHLLKNPTLYDLAIRFARLSIKKANPVMRFYYSARGRNDNFYLSEEFATDIRAYCNPFNQNLAKSLGREISELSELGY